MKRLFVGVIAAALVAIATLFATMAPTNAMEVNDISSLRDSLKKITAPKIENPTWYKNKLAAQAAAAAQSTVVPNGRIITYDTMTKGAITANFSEFQTLANQTLNDARGWARMGVSFKQVASGGEFTLVLAEASQVPTFSSGCSSTYSCRAGRYVIINQDRWLGATDPWNVAGGSLRDYRHMVVNHETGHWLGHSHAYCSAAGMPAPVMQQQSIGLQGCKFNPWPLASELWIGS